VSYLAFYSIDGMADVAADKAVAMDRHAVIAELLRAMHDDMDFFGLMDDQGATLQVMYHADEGRYWFEIPVAAEGGSYGRAMSLDEAVAQIEGLPPTFALVAFPTFAFTSWGDD
jgi:hypothetical protein